MKNCTNCSSEHDRDGELCFRCHVKGISFTLRGGAILGNKGWNTTKSEWLQENVGGTERELAKNPNVEKVS